MTVFKAVMALTLSGKKACPPCRELKQGNSREN